MKEIIDKLEKVFSLYAQKENFSEVMESIENSIPFKGTNLWILIFAIFIASLGLNVNSTAVIIGAMLISPLMGPIIGIGFSVGINHPNMLKLALKNYAFASIIGLITSMVYFLITPLSDAHSEILARTSPNIYDVFIAFFGGAAGMLANGSKQKGNVIPGVAIATALMPPLCTAGYGIATGEWRFFFGALYLYFINTVYIAVSTFLVVKVLNFPTYRYTKNASLEKRSQKIMWGLVIATLIPSIYFGYSMIRKNNFENTANNFITNEAIFPNNFLLQKEISYENNEIQLTYGGQKLEEKDLNQLDKRLRIYGLDSVKIKVNQGFNFTNDKQEVSALLQENEKSRIEKENMAKMIAFQDSIARKKELVLDIFQELKTQNTHIKGFTITDDFFSQGSTGIDKNKLIFVKLDTLLSDEQKEKLKSYLKVRIKDNSAKVIITK
ncbi:MAG: DUF389 domain-containing protein [Flavobacteriales bacterium]|nr:MAG: DUF389 domain-containing protein [Flavobacteriales bacterium]